MDPATASIALGAASFGGSALKGYGQYSEGRAAGEAYDYNAQLAEQNAAFADQRAAWSAEEGDQAASAAQMKARAVEGGVRANQGASGVDVNSGSSVDVQESVRQTGMLDALTVRSNAARQAYGYQVEAVNDRAQAALDRSAAKNSRKAGVINAAATLLGGGASSLAYSDYMNKRSVLPTQ